MNIPDSHIIPAIITAKMKTAQLLNTPRSIMIRQGTPSTAKHVTNTRHRTSTRLENENST